MVNFAFLSMAWFRKQLSTQETHSMNTFYLTWCFSIPCLSCLVSSRFSLCPIWTHSLTAHVEKTREHLNNYHCTSHETEKWWAQHLLQIIYVGNLSGDFECIASELKSSGTILRQQPCKLNPCPSVCYLHALTKEQGKETRALPKKNPRLLTTIWQRKDVWKTLFQNKSSGTINPVHLPQTTPEQNKEGVNKNTLSISNLAQYFILQLWRNIPLTTMTSIELRLLNTCCITQKVRCWGGNNQKDIAKEQGHGRMTYKVFSLNPFY